MGTKKKNEQLLFVDAWTSYIRQHSSKIYIQIRACFFRQQYFRSTYLDGQLEVLNVDFAAVLHMISDIEKVSSCMFFIQPFGWV